MQHQGYGMTKKEYEKYKTLAYARHDVTENQQKFIKPITDADVAYMKKALNAPDVNMFIQLV